MKLVTEVSLSDFEAWSGGFDTLAALKVMLTEDALDSLESWIVNEVFESEELTDTQLNDFLWFESDTIANHFGYDSWEDFEKNYGKEDADDEEDYDDSEEETDEED